MRHHYETMGLDRSSTAEEVKAAWRALSRKLHPDRRGGTAEANAEFAALSQASFVLSDPKARARYDAELAVGSDQCLPCKGSGRTWKSSGFTKTGPAVCAECAGSGRTEKKAKRYGAKGK